MSTASCNSALTYIDGDRGILRYRGYPIEQLAEQSSFLKLAYLLLYDELPTRDQLGELTGIIAHHTMINAALLRFFQGFHYDAHPMAMMVGVTGSLSAFYHGSINVHDPRNREISAHRSGIIYQALGIPRNMFTVMFAIARTAGWVAHWMEMMADPDHRIGRPRQI